MAFGGSSADLPPVKSNVGPRTGQRDHKHVECHLLGLLGPKSQLCQRNDTQRRSDSWENVKFIERLFDITRTDPEIQDGAHLGEMAANLSAVTNAQSQPEVADLGFLTLARNLTPTEPPRATPGGWPVTSVDAVPAPQLSPDVPGLQAAAVVGREVDQGPVGQSLTVQRPQDLPWGQGTGDSVTGSARWTEPPHRV
jgi:hypothetical protein